MKQAQAGERMHGKGTEWFMQFSFLCAAAAGLVYIGKAASVITAVRRHGNRHCEKDRRTVVNGTGYDRKTWLVLIWPCLMPGNI